jgi:hypothetical protein
LKYPVNSTTGKVLDRADAMAFAKNNGIPGAVKQPRNLQAQSGSRKILVTWDAPEKTEGIIGYRVYTDSEFSLLDTISDPNVRQYSVPASAGASPPTKNIFISAFSKQAESLKVQIQGKATAEAGAPADPAPPPGSAASGTTGRPLGIDGSGDAGFIRGR